MKILLPILLTLFACDQVTNGYRILGLFPLHGKSHWVMMEQLMKGLARRGHQVDVVTHFPLKKSEPNYKDISIAGSLATVINNVTAQDVKGFGSFNMKYFAYIAGDRVCQLLELPQFQELIKNPPNDPPYDLIIVELFVAPCYLAFGRHLKVPVVGTITTMFQDWLSTAVGNPYNPAFMPSMFSMFDPQMTFWERTQNTVLSTIVGLQLHYYMNQQTEYVKKHFGDDTPIEEFYKDLSLILVNSHHSLHGIRPLTPAVVNVGGLQVSDDGDPLSPEVKKWLDESTHGCVYFTFGSMVRIETFPKETVTAFYKAFEKIAPVRVLMKVAKKEDLLPGLPKNVMIQSWFPQIAVLKHKNVKAFLTHGGGMGTQESIYCGVPLIGIPLFGDQHVNIMTYVRKNVAVSLGSPQNVTEETLTWALNTVLHDETYRSNAKELSALFKDRPQSALDTAIYWVEYVGRHKNILQSPAIHLNWWQRNLVDVYGFILACVVTLLLIVFLILRALKNLVCGSKACSKKAKESKKNK